MEKKKKKKCLMAKSSQPRKKKSRQELRNGASHAESRKWPETHNYDLTAGMMITELHVIDSAIRKSWDVNQEREAGKQSDGLSTAERGSETPETPRQRRAPLTASVVPLGNRKMTPCHGFHRLLPHCWRSSSRNALMVEKKIPFKSDNSFSLIYSLPDRHK